MFLCSVLSKLQHLIVNKLLVSLHNAQKKFYIAKQHGITKTQMIKISKTFYFSFLQNQTRSFMHLIPNELHFSFI